MTEVRLDIVPLLDTTPRRFVFVIGGIGYETMDGLRMHVEVMPKDQVIVLDPGCKRLGGEPLLEFEEEMAAFKAFVKKNGVTLKIIPSG